jgi:hypothetical protein
VETQQPQNEVLVVSGIFNPRGDSLLRLNPVRRYAWKSGVLPSQQAGTYAMRVTFASGKATSIPFDALVAADAEGGSRHGFFEIVIPIREKVRSVLITDVSGKKIFAHLTDADIP